MPIKIGTVGYVLRLTIRDEQTRMPINLSNATIKQIILISPRGQEKVFSASFTNDGVDGKIQYTTQAGDITEGGDLKLRAYFSTPSLTGITSEVTLQVSGTK